MQMHEKRKRIFRFRLGHLICMLIRLDRHLIILPLYCGSYDDVLASVTHDILMINKQISYCKYIA